MEHSIIILLFSPILSVQTLHAHEAPAVTFDAVVVLSIMDLDDASLAKLSAEIGKAKNATLEYSCTWSGAVVLTFSEISAGEPADEPTLVRCRLNAARIERGVEFVHVRGHVEARCVGVLIPRSGPWPTV